MATTVGHPEKLRGGGRCSIKTRRIKSVPDHRIPPFLDPVSGWATFMNINCSLMVSDIDEGMMRRPHSVGHLHSPTEGGGHRPLSYYWVRLVVGLSHTSGPSHTNQSFPKMWKTDRLSFLWHLNLRICYSRRQN